MAKQPQTTEKQWHNAPMWCGAERKAIRSRMERKLPVYFYEGRIDRERSRKGKVVKINKKSLIVVTAKGVRWMVTYPKGVGRKMQPKTPAK